MHTISFPGLGIPEFTINETAFTLFGLEVKWYGVILTFGILCALTLFYYLARKVEDLPENHLYNLALFTVPLGIVGARVIYVATRWEYYAGDIGKMINIREGGLAIYGGINFVHLSPRIPFIVTYLPPFCTHLSAIAQNFFLTYTSP